LEESLWGFAWVGNSRGPVGAPIASHAVPIGRRILFGLGFCLLTVMLPKRGGADNGSYAGHEFQSLVHTFVYTWYAIYDILSLYMVSHR